MYFIQHLLFPGNLVSADDGQSPAADTPTTLEDLPSWLQTAVAQLSLDLQRVLFTISQLPNISTPDGFPLGFPIESLPESYREAEKLSVGLHTALQAIDPAMAARWHWRDIRKVRRSVEVAIQTGKPHSQIIVEQKKEPVTSEYVFVKLVSSNAEPNIEIPDACFLAIRAAVGARSKIERESTENGRGQ